MIRILKNSLLLILVISHYQMSGQIELFNGATLTLDNDCTFNSNIRINTNSGSSIIESFATINATNGIDSKGTLDISSNSIFNASNGIGFVLDNTGTLKISIEGVTAGVNHGQVKVNGILDVKNSSLSVSGSYTATSGDLFLLVDNDATDQVQGTFIGLPEGATTILNGVALYISYIGGDGNDIVLSFDNPLPAELISFHALSEEENINLLWKTVSEANNSGFEIQKSNNGREWEIIEFVEGRGTTTEISEYHYQDINPFSGVNYYRLKQIDFDGAFEYSKVISVDYNNSKRNIEVFPNPSSGIINLQIDNLSVQRIKIKISDNLGRKVWESELIEGESNWRKEIEIEENGIYFVTTQIGDEIYYEQVIITDVK